MSTAYNYLYSTYQYSKTSLLSSSNILISKESSLITQTSLLSPSNILIPKESSLIKSASFSSTSFLIDKSSTNLHISTQLNTSSTLPITFNSHSSLLIYTSQAIISNSKFSDKINSFPIIYTAHLTIDISSISKIEIIEEEIITEKINITKENLIYEIPFIIKNVEVGKIYKKIGDDYNILIYPTNSTFLSSISHVNFSECETLLRNHYEIPDSTIITILQLELENENSQSLINQVEYEAYIENKTHLDLSLCNNTNIHVIYAIKNKSLIDFSKAISFKNSGIDIFNINDSFFNDICQPYSESDNDMILEDRIKDIYQNYSLCEIGCNYNKIDLENMTISCKCKTKDNISLVITPLNLEKTEESSTNFDVIKCYKLVFSLKGKLKNIGFLIFLLLIIIHIPFLFYYFCIGIKLIKMYIIEEMKKYGYIKDKKNKNNNFKRKKINHTKTTKPRTVHTKIIRSNKKKNKTNLSIKKIRVINNSSLINIMKSSNREITSDKNNDKRAKINNKKKTIKMNKKHKNSKLNLIKVNKNLNKKNFSHITTANISEDGVKNNNANKFSLINIDLNLYRHKQYIPPNSHIILDNYTFQEAIKFDLRELCEIFYIFALSKQILFHTFLYISPLELFSLRFCLFIFIISSDLALNALFYFNDNISKKYRYAKNLFLFTFSDNITIIIISTFVGFILLTLFSKLANSINDIRDVFRKEEEKLKNNKKYNITGKRKAEIISEIEQILKKYKIKIIILIIIEIIIMIFYWYFVNAFCHVYHATQKSWLFDSFISMLSRGIIELLISLGLAKLYRMAIEGESHCLYKAVMFLYNFR